MIDSKTRKANLREFLRDSKVRRIVYHATSADFRVFDTNRSDLGAHFGTLEQVLEIAAQGRGVGNMSILPVYLRIRRPLRLKDVGSFHADGIAPQLAAKGWMDKKEARRIVAEIDRDWKLRKQYDPLMRQLITDRGFDGIVYKNAHEAAPADSYIVFYPQQIKSAIGNCGAFDMACSDICA